MPGLLGLDHDGATRARAVEVVEVADGVQPTWPVWLRTFEEIL